MKFRPRSSTVILASLLLLAGRSAVAMDDSQEREGWRIGLGGLLGFTVQKAEAELSTSDVLGPQTAIPAPDPRVIWPAVDGKSTQTGGLIQVNLEASTPELLGNSFGRPRLFMHVDVGGNFALEDDVTRATNGARKLFLDPRLDVVNELDPDAVLGQGVRASLRLDPATYSAGFGAAFEWECLERTMRLKPSVEYLYQRMEAAGLVSRAIIINSVGVNPDGLEDFRHILIEARRDKVFHGAGAGLEFEMDVTPIDSFVVSWFANVRAYNILGGRDFSIYQANKDPAPNANREFARFRVSVDEWMYRAGVGVRIRWSPDL
ncbi:MAG: hypothetical protein R3E53_16710 [Myxococcota bacterium]